MPRSKNKLTAVAVRKAPPGKLQDGGGLILDKSADGGKWLYRYSIGGRRREMGLGTLADVTLADARKARDRWAAVILEGRDPITERNRQAAETAAELSKSDPTLDEVARIVFEAKREGLRGGGNRGRWFSPLRVHVLPKLGRRRISTIHQSDVADVLRPIWKAKTATAEKAIQRLHIIFRHAKMMGLEADPFTVEAARYMLGEVQRKTVSIVATPWQEVPDLFAKLDRNYASYQCLRWIILTATRGTPARGARFSEIEGDVWTVPADRMKGNEGKAQPFTVPLSTAALELLEEIRALAHDDLMFPSSRTGFISENALLKVLNGLGEAGRPHGFRTTFRTWAQDTEAASYDVVETALAHIVGSRVERTYARSDLLDLRRPLMERWGRHVTGAEADVIRLRG